MSGRPNGPRTDPHAPGPRTDPHAPGPRTDPHAPGPRTGPHPAEAPLLPPARAARLLEDVIFARVAELIDLPAIFDLEAMLALQLESLGADAGGARATARAMVDRALARVAQTSRRWTHRPPPPAGDACELCGGLCDLDDEDAGT